ncbi:MAG: sulfotransferase domain-containing protein [Bacteroidetes bacterium]|nr:sulfotransferase domain-containing protein [Bacteroidota bacterium]
MVGAAKAGTTSLYHYLSQHPDVYMSPIKEPNYFSTEIKFEEVRTEVKERIRLLKISSFLKGSMSKPIHRAFINDIKQYESLFRFANSQKAIGEASASYLHSPYAAKAIKEYNPDAKITIILRNPIQRIYSHYLMDRRMGITNLPFAEALEAEKIYQPRQWGATSLYLELGEYSKQIKRYIEQFPSHQIIILFREELEQDGANTMKKVFEFLEIDNTFQPKFEINFNTAMVPRNSFVKKIISFNTLRINIRRTLKNSFIKRYIKQAFFSKPQEEKLSLENQQKMIDYYRNDIQELSQLIQKDLSQWLQIK